MKSHQCQRLLRMFEVDEAQLIFTCMVIVVITPFAKVVLEELLEATHPFYQKHFTVQLLSCRPLAKAFVIIFSVKASFIIDFLIFFIIVFIKASFIVLFSIKPFLISFIKVLMWILFFKIIQAFLLMVAQGLDVLAFGLVFY